MVLLTITPAMQDGLKALRHSDSLAIELSNLDSDPSLHDPAVEDPISHGQVLTLWRFLQDQRRQSGKNNLTKGNPFSYHLDDLLRGSKIYREPVRHKPEPSPEYRALMARLRRDEEARAYERMINPPPPTETFEQRFPNSINTKVFAENSANTHTDDEMTYADVNRQLALIINILLSVVACSAAIWMISSHWSTAKRLGLSMGGSCLVGVAEVAVYAGYIRRLKEARRRGAKHVEIKEIIKTWVIGGENREEYYADATMKLPKCETGDQIRKRKSTRG
ncbi:MAG: hypothetical protein Q9214_000409 [Letrouitia sp. 1 TL-2023]